MSATETKKEICVSIRWMLRIDMPEILTIEEGSFKFPWWPNDFICCLRGRNHIGAVAEHKNHVVGFMIYELYKARIHLLNFAVHPEFRRKRVGSKMLARLIAKLSLQRRKRITLEVRETNLVAQLFFRECGFKAIGILRDHYEETAEDAYIMQYRCERVSQSAPTPQSMSPR